MGWLKNRMMRGAANRAYRRLADEFGVGPATGVLALAIGHACYPDATYGDGGINDEIIRKLRLMAPGPCATTIACRHAEAYLDLGTLSTAEVFRNVWSRTPEEFLHCFFAGFEDEGIKHNGDGTTQAGSGILIETRLKGGHSKAPRADMAAWAILAGIMIVLAAGVLASVIGSRDRNVTRLLPAPERVPDVPSAEASTVAALPAGHLQLEKPTGAPSQPATLSGQLKVVEIRAGYEAVYRKVGETEGVLRYRLVSERTSPQTLWEGEGVLAFKSAPWKQVAHTTDVMRNPAELGVTLRRDDGELLFVRPQIAPGRRTVARYPVY